jgi:hypothetical protein
MALFILVTGKAFAQQSFSTSFLGDVKKPGNWKKEYEAEIKKKAGMSKMDKEKLKADLKEANKLGLPIFGIQGIGNINQEALESFNASGKISFYARPVQWRNNAITILASYNKNASNNDSVLFQKLIFPEIGNNSFLGTVEISKFWKYETAVHALSPFFEFSYKDIKSDSSVENQRLYFTSLTYTTGLKYVYGFKKPNPDDAQKFTSISFYAIPYFSILNIPNEDTADYRALLKRNVKAYQPNKPLSDNIYTAGFKIGFQINGLQVFADFRNVLNKEESLPIRELRGFNANIGIIFSADAIEFYK